MKILSLGLTFIPKPRDSSDNDIIDSFERFARQLRLKKQFGMSTWDPKSLDALLRIPNPDFAPNNAGLGLEHYLNTVEVQLQRKLKECPAKEAKYNLIESLTKKLRNDKSIVISRSDKSKGIVITNRIDYETEILRHLEDGAKYRRVHKQPTTDILAKPLENILCRHRLDNTQLAQYLLQFAEAPLRYARAYLNWKTHKEGPLKGRIVAATNGTAIYNASKYVDKCLQQLMQEGPAYIKDSNEYVKIMNRTSLPIGVQIMMADVENLYPSIPINTAIASVKRALTAQTHVNDDIDINLICDLLHWILKNNYLECADSTWQQLDGLAIGSPVAVVVACIYLTDLEAKVIAKCRTHHDWSPPLLYKRFIDDIASYWSDKPSAELFVKYYNSIDVNIHITHTTAEDGIFLDTYVFKGEQFARSGIMDMKVYQKPSNEYVYIPPTSYHHKSVFTGMMKSESNRYAARTTNQEDLRQVNQEFIHRLMARGHREIDINKNIAPFITHQAAIQKLSTPIQPKQPGLIFITFNTPRIKQLDLSNILKPTMAARSDPDFLQLFPRHSTPIICKKRTQNLADMVKRSKLSGQLQQR
jgi:hypothetical protein